MEPSVSKQIDNNNAQCSTNNKRQRTAKTTKQLCPLEANKPGKRSQLVSIISKPEAAGLIGGKEGAICVRLELTVQWPSEIASRRHWTGAKSGLSLSPINSAIQWNAVQHYGAPVISYGPPISSGGLEASQLGGKEEWGIFGWTL